MYHLASFIWLSLNHILDFLMWTKIFNAPHLSFMCALYDLLSK